ncbi:MAG: peptidylprolyl isomerase [Planctomycetota bacterium]|nr:peptidylprolyl isomerase [Planctomycetota bacterium]MDA1251792.1 peptidylprolyl isomerase [Planctomycetota bacterium]
MARATARHILVSDEATCEQLKQQITGGADFAALAKEHSSCPSGRQGGDLGEFGPGQMVPEFDQVVFNEAVNVVHGPVQTQFGYHLLEVTSRTE